MVSFTSHLLAAADLVGERTGWLQKPMRAETLLHRARRQTGHDDLGDFQVLPALQILLDAITSEASLSAFGRLAARWDSVRQLGNLLRLRAEEHKEPRILDAAIDKPLFIAGLPRSGTSFLHRLLMGDAQNRAPLVWETMYPYPPERGADERVAQVAQQLRTFERVAPDFHAAHPLFADSPQECSEITAQVFQSLRYDTTYDIPSYRRWLDRMGHHAAYAFHKRFLQHLQQQDPAPRRWVLKCPDHVFALAEIRETYPDARMVFVHRDPVKVLLSVARLTELIRGPFTRRTDPRAIGRQESLRWREGARRMLLAAWGDNYAGRICHVHYLDLIFDPIATIEQIYGHFGMELSGTARERMQEMVTQPRGPRRYRFDDHGFDPDEERRKFREYMVEFGIQAEA